MDWPWKTDKDYTPTERASALNLAKICPGSIFLGQSVAENSTDNEFTNIGTKGHKWLEMAMKSGTKTADTLLADSDTEFRATLHEFWQWFLETGIADGDGLAVEGEVSFKCGPVNVTGHYDLLSSFGDHLHIVDYKFYNDPSLLPPVEDDLQMLAYAVGIAGDAKEVSVHRILCYHQRDDILHLDASEIAEARERLESTCTEIWENRERLTVGGQCTTCLLRFNCPKFDALCHNIEATEMQPYQGGLFETEDNVKQFILALPSLEARMKIAKEAAQAWVLENGPLFDPVSGKYWSGMEVNRDTIEDHYGCVQDLASAVGVDGANSAIRTTKSALDAALKEAGVKPKSRTGFFDGLREKGAIVKKPAGYRFIWKSPKKELKA